MNQIEIRRPKIEEFQLMIEFFKEFIIDTFNCEGLGHLQDIIENELKQKKKYLTDYFNTNGKIIAIVNYQIIVSIEYGASNALIKKYTD